MATSTTRASHRSSAPVRAATFSAGPLARYDFKLRETAMNASLRWITEFGTQNRQRMMVFSSPYRLGFS
jgi:hypothetical protein